MRDPGESWRGAYQRMFVRHRDQIRDEIRTGVRPYLSERKRDELAWRQAEEAIQVAIRQHDEAEQRRKRRMGVAA